MDAHPVRADTELLLALLASQFNPVPDTHLLIDALAAADGDVDRAARALRRPPKRKRNQTDLDDWLDSPQSPSRTRNLALPSSPTPSRERSRPIISLNDVLRDAPSTSKVIKLDQPPPLKLLSDQAVAERTPCTMHRSILPLDLATRLLRDMLSLAEGWGKNRWWLFEKVVESPHKTSFFIRKREGGLDLDAAAQYWYNGRPTDAPPEFPSVMEEACQYIEKVVNQEMAKRQRFPLEWAGSEWKANVAAANCYTGPKESVGFHSDQLTYLGPYPTIASLSLGTTRVFRLREVVPASEKDQRKPQTFDIPLQHNTLIIMHASAQENFKHAIPPQRVIDAYHIKSEDAEQEGESSVSRINITFRFYRPDFAPSTTPTCLCGKPCILRPDMKGRNGQGLVTRFWWTCYAGAQNDGKGCNMWKEMDCVREGRGPTIGIPGV